MWPCEGENRSIMSGACLNEECNTCMWLLRSTRSMLSYMSLCMWNLNALLILCRMRFLYYAECALISCRVRSYIMQNALLVLCYTYINISASRLCFM